MFASAVAADGITCGASGMATGALACSRWGVRVIRAPLPPGYAVPREELAICDCWAANLPLNGRMTI